MRTLWSSTWLSLRLTVSLRVWIPRLASTLGCKGISSSTRRITGLEYLLLVAVILMPAPGCKLRKDPHSKDQLWKDIWLRILLNQIKSTVDKQDMFLLNKLIKQTASESFKSFWLLPLWFTAINIMTMNHLQAKMKSITLRNSKAGRGTKLTLMIRFEVKWFISTVEAVEKFLNQWLRSSRCKIKLTPLLIRSLALFHQWVLFSRKSSHIFLRFSVTWGISYLNSGRPTKSNLSSSASRSHMSSIEGSSGSWT